MSEWISMKDCPPTQNQEILFTTHEALTDERMGIAVVERKLILLRRTDIGFEDVKWWLPIPEAPSD